MTLRLDGQISVVKQGSNELIEIDGSDFEYAEGKVVTDDEGSTRQTALFSYTSDSITITVAGSREQGEWSLNEPRVTYARYLKDDLSVGG